jgi:hypothetical protein
MTILPAFAVLAMMFHFAHAKMPRYDVNRANENFLSLLALMLFSKQPYYTGVTHLIVKG